LGPLLCTSFVAAQSLISASLLSLEEHAQMPWQISATTLGYWFSGEEDSRNPHW